MGLDRRTKRGKECSKDAFPLNQGLPSVYHIVKVSLNTMRNIPRSRFGPNHRCLVIIYTAQEQLLGYSGWGQVASSTHVLKGSLSACTCIGRIWHFKRWAKWKKLNHQRCVLEGDFETGPFLSFLYFLAAMVFCLPQVQKQRSKVTTY